MTGFSCTGIGAGRGMAFFESAIRQAEAAVFDMELSQKRYTPFVASLLTHSIIEVKT